jgi:hypothetical protein
MVANFANDLLAIGVKGFLIDGAKFMWPDHLKKMQVCKILYYIIYVYMKQC